MSRGKRKVKVDRSSRSSDSMPEREIVSVTVTDKKVRVFGMDIESKHENPLDGLSLIVDGIDMLKNIKVRESIKLIEKY